MGNFIPDLPKFFEKSWKVRAGFVSPPTVPRSGDREYGLTDRSVRIPDHAVTLRVTPTVHSVIMLGGMDMGEKAQTATAQTQVAHHVANLDGRKIVAVTDVSVLADDVQAHVASFLRAEGLLLWRGLSGCVRRSCRKATEPLLSCWTVATS